MPVERGNIFNKTYLSITVHTVYHIMHRIALNNAHVDTVISTGTFHT